MSADLEARLRASLRAYAELVEEPEGDVIPPVRPAAAVRRWRAPLLVAASVVAVAGGGWLAVGVIGAGAPPSQGGTEHAASAPAADRATDDASPLDAPEGSAADAAAVPATIGETVPFELATHCGVLGAYVDGVWFAADPPLTDGSGHPPPDWGDPAQPGMLTRLSADTAEFRDDLGHRVRLRAAADEEPPPCE